MFWLLLVMLIDFNNIRVYFKKVLDLKSVSTLNDDFFILVPIFGNLKYLKNVEFLKKYGSKVILCTTDKEDIDFIATLQNLAKLHNFGIKQLNIGRSVKNPWAIFYNLVDSNFKLPKNHPDRLNSKYFIFIDGDTIAKGDLYLLFGAMEENNFDVSSVKVLPSREESIIEKLQSVEYNIAMRSRILYPWLTSGAAIVSKREVLEKIMKNHSLFFNGGDIEIGKLAHIMGYKVGHIPMVFETDVPETIKKWTKQRFAWLCGCFRHYIINADQNLHFPFHFIYYSFVLYFMLPFKIIDMYHHIYYVPIIFFFYGAATYFLNWPVRNRWMLIFPIYAFFQSSVIIWFGILKYAKTVWQGKNIGKIKVREVNTRAIKKNWSFYKKLATNTSIIIFVLAILTLATSSYSRAEFDGKINKIKYPDKLSINILKYNLLNNSKIFLNSACEAICLKNSSKNKNCQKFCHF